MEKDKLTKQRENYVIDLERFQVMSSLIERLEAHDSDVEVLRMNATLDPSLIQLENAHVKGKLRFHYAHR